MTAWEVTFRTYCYGCRRGRRWHGAGLADSTVRCIWRQHRFDWEYYVSVGGIRVVQRGAFKSFDLARASASRSLSRITRALAR